MHILSPSAELLWITSDVEKIIELAGRTCYKSENQITDDSASRFVRMIIKRGHESVIEHASASIRFVCDRGVTHELVRHRIASYSQESTRYCNYGKEKFGGVTFIQPPELLPEQLKRWVKFCETAEQVYLYMLKDGVKPQIARSVLPNCLKTEIVTTCNLREWRHIIKLRTSPQAHPQIREIIESAANILKRHCPNIFFDI